MQDWESKRVTIGYDTICKQCGKEFLRQPEWIYKGRKKNEHHYSWLCSYTCMNKYKKGAC